MSSSINLLIADDHHILAEALKSSLESESDINVVALAHSGDEALYQLRRFRVDVLLLDINMPGRDGISVLELLQQQQWPGHSLILSLYDDAVLIKKCLKLGAKGYLTKAVCTIELLEAIHHVVSGKIYLSADVRRGLAYHDDPYDRFTLRYHLTDRELKVVRLLTEDKTSEEMADTLCTSTHTIDAVRKTLLKKLNVRSVAGVVSWAWRWLAV